VGHAIARWRRRYGGEIARWLAAAGEAEALASFAAHAFDHPDDAFPDVTAEGPLFDAAGLGHPLLGSEGMVRNDLRLDRTCPALIVSGSNMSGKSTLLRAVGVNAVLALAGGTVRATRLVLSELAIGASIRTEDSLLDGRSRFQAEILRLKRLVELAEGGRPLLFLLDEILAGTNSHDRRIGAEHVLRGLLARGAIGLVTTHDLALADIAGDATRMRNVHFQDRLDGDRMWFDYRLHPGVVETSNALALMRAIGLEVPAVKQTR
jgi:DNA mismatch repair ATPase MutS